MNAMPRAHNLPALTEELRREVTSSREERGLPAKRRSAVCAPSGVVLVVEDDEAMAELTCSVVRSAGLPCVHVADTLRAAMAALKELPVRAAVVDWSLPDGTSAFLVQTLLSMGVPVVVCSASLPGAIEDIAGAPRIHKEGNFGPALRAWLQEHGGATS